MSWQQFRKKIEDKSTKANLFDLCDSLIDVSKYFLDRRSVPTDPFATLELRHPSHGVSELHGICRYPNPEARKRVGRDILTAAPEERNHPLPVERLIKSKYCICYTCTILCKHCLFSWHLCIKYIHRQPYMCARFFFDLLPFIVWEQIKCFFLLAKAHFPAN